MPASAPPPRRSVRHLRRATVWLLEALGVVAAGAVILTGVLAFRISQGPFPVDFLSPYLVRALEGIDPGIKVAIGDTVLIWNNDTLQIRAREVRVQGPEGEERASVPELSVSLSIPALFRGLLAPSSLEVYGLQVRLVRTAEGRIEFGGGGAPAAAPESQPAPDAPSSDAPSSDTPPAVETQAELSDEGVKALIGLFAGPPDPDVRGSYLRRISVAYAEFILEDRKSGHVWRAPEANLSVIRDRASAEGRATLAVDLGTSHPKLDVRARYAPEIGRAHV